MCREIVSVYRETKSVCVYSSGVARGDRGGPPRAAKLRVCLKICQGEKNFKREKF